MIVEWRGVRIVVESDEDFEYFRHAVDTLILPYTLVKGGASMLADCCKTIEVRVGPLSIPVKFVDWCHTETTTKNYKIDNSLLNVAAYNAFYGLPKQQQRTTS